MITLYRFEDTYGMFAIFCKVLNVSVDNTCNSLVKLRDDVYAESGLGASGVMSVNENKAASYKRLGISRIVFVFDADNPSGDKTGIMPLAYLKNQVENLSKSCSDFSLEFMLCVYAAESIMLYQTLHGSDFNLDSLVSPYDTNKFQNILLAYQYDIRHLKSLKTSILKYIDANVLLSECKRLKDNNRVLNKDVLSWIASGGSPSFSCMSADEVLGKLIKAEIIHDHFCNNPRNFILNGELTAKSIQLSTDMSIDALHKIL